MEYTTSELRAIGETAERIFCNILGYDLAAFESVRVHADGDIEYVFTLRDDFQRELPAEHRVDHEFYRSIDMEKILELSPSTWRTREQRELAVMARQLGALNGKVGEIRSAQARQFVDDLTRLSSDIAGLIEASK